MDSIRKLMAEEASLRDRIEKAIDQITSQIAEDIESQSLEGVETVSSSPAIAIVRFSALQREGCWAPATFIPASQANAVRRKLSSCKTLVAMQKAIQEMVDTKCAKISKTDTVRLNSKTIEILQTAQI